MKLAARRVQTGMSAADFGEIAFPELCHADREWQFRAPQKLTSSQLRFKAPAAAFSPAPLSK
jgi:hypothetical protein